MTTAVMSEAQLRTHYAGVISKSRNNVRVVRKEDPEAVLAEVRGDLLRAKRDNVRLVVEIQNLQAQLHIKTEEALKLTKELEAINHSEEPADGDYRPVEDIVNEVLAQHPGVTWRHVKGRMKCDKYVTPRHECVWAVRVQRPDLSWLHLARIFKRDHTSLMYAYRKMQAERDGVKFDSKRKRAAAE